MPLKVDFFKKFLINGAKREKCKFLVYMIDLKTDFFLFCCDTDRYNCTRFMQILLQNWRIYKICVFAHVSIYVICKTFWKSQQS